MSVPIASLKNPRVKLIRSLDGRKARDETRLFFVEGMRIVAEAAHARADIDTLVVAPELLTDRASLEVVQALGRRGVPRLEVTPDVFRAISRRANSKGLGAVVRQAWEPLEGLRLADDQFALALSEVADPGNLGTIVRTCDAVGTAALILIGDATDPYHPTALSASTGAIFSRRLAKTTFAPFATWARGHRYHIVGTSSASGRDYRQVSYERPLVLLMGGESLGLPSEQQAVCDLLVTIPMVGRTGSLNLSVATGLMLYEVFSKGRRRSG